MKKLFFAAALLFAAVSCQKEEFIAPVEGKTVLEVSLDNATKTGLSALNDGARKIYWLQGDKLSWSGNASEPLGEEYTAAAALTNATFTWKGILNRPCDILYPASMYTDATHVTLPATQGDSKAEDAIATDVLPMYTHIGEDGTVSKLKCLTGLVKISWKLPAENADSHKMKIIEFKGNNNEQVSGKFEIDYTTGALTSTSTADADKMVTVIANRTATAETPCCCLISVPAGTYENGFTVTLVDQYGHFMEKSKSSSFEVTPGKVIKLPEFEFAPTGTRITVITDASEWNAYASAYNSGDYTDAVITANLDFTDKAIVNITKAYQNNLSGYGSKFMNVSTDKALFENIGSEATVENIVFDESYKIEAVANDNIGAVVKNLHGTLSGVKFNGIFDFSYDSEATRFVGGIASKMLKNAKMENCEFNGKLRNSSVGDSVLYQYIGGIVASVYDDPEMEKTLKDCTFGGQIIIGDGSTSAGLTQSDDTQYRIGGIAARLACVNVSGLNSTAGASIFVGGKFSNLSVGGIVADERAEMSGCTNSASIKVVTEGDAGSTIQVGGVIGSALNSTSGYDRRFTNCTNNGDIEVEANNENVFVAGVLSTNYKGFYAGAQVTGDAILSDGFENKGNITYKGTCDMLFVGGILAMDRYSKNNRTGDYVNTGNITILNNARNFTAVGGYTGCLASNDIRTSNTGGIVKPSNLHKNTGAISVDVTDASYSPDNGFVVVGGLIGFSSFSVVSEEAGKVLNEGKVTLNVTKDVPDGTAVTSVGGIAGYLYRKSVKTFQYLSNSGTINLYYPDKTTKVDGLTGCAGFCCGGIVGSCDGEAHQFLQNTNSGQINGDGTKNSVATRAAYLGGILGKAYGAYAYQIKDCLNTGGIYSHIDGSTKVIGARACAGGILGYGKGSAFPMKNATVRDTSKVFAIYNCECREVGSGTSSTKGQIYSYRGNTGGIVGYADQYTHVFNCRNHMTITGGNGYNCTGGIVGCAGTYSAIDYCTCDSKVQLANSSSGNTYAAGILGNGGNVGDNNYPSSQYFSITHCTYDNTDGVKANKAAHLITNAIINSSSYAAIPCGAIQHCAVRGRVGSGDPVAWTVADAGNFLDCARPSGSEASVTGTHLIE